MQGRVANGKRMAGWTLAVILFLGRAGLGAQTTDDALCPPSPLSQSKPARALADALTRYNTGVLKSEYWSRLWDVYGPVEVCSEVQDASRPNRAFVWTRGLITKGNLGLSVELTPNGEVDGFGNLMGIHPEHGASLKPLSVDGLVREAQSYLTALERSDYFSGVVLVAKGDTPLFVAAFGPASIRYNVENRADTRFDVASVTKTLTALAIVQLAEQGKLSYSDPIRKFLPGYPAEFADVVTVHQLLTHSAGVPRTTFHLQGLQSKTVRAVKDWLPMTVGKLEFEPGTSVRYSNEGFLLLGAIVENVSGENYYDYVRNHIYRPAGMTSSGAFEMDEELPNLATGYTRWRWPSESEVRWESGSRRMSIVRKGMKGSPAAGTYSTALDLLRLSRALQSGRLVKPESWQLMAQRHMALPPFPGAAFGEGYGYGFDVATLHGVRYVGKSGGSHGNSARFDMYPDLGYTVVVLSNYDSIANIVADYLADLIVRASLAK